MRPLGRLLPLLLVMALIFLLSHQPGDRLHLPDVWSIDKLAHFLVYALLALTAIHAFSPLSKNRGFRFSVLIILLCVLYGVGDEVHQSFIPNRSSSGWDIVADALGAGIVTAAWLSGLFRLPGTTFTSTTK